MIHDVITTANPFPYTAKFMFVGVRNDQTYTNQTLKHKIRIYSVAYIPYSKRVDLEDESLTLFHIDLFFSFSNNVSNLFWGRPNH